MGKTIWYISKYAAPTKYGFGSRHFCLADEFAKQGHAVVVISSDSNHLATFPEFENEHTREQIGEVDVLWLKTAKYKRTASLKRVFSWLDFEYQLWRMPDDQLPKPDVIIVSSLSLFTILNGWRLKKKFGCKLVFEVRDIWPLTLVEEGGASKWNPFVLLLAGIEKYGYLKSDVIVGTMPNLAEHVKKVTGRELNCHCIPFGYDPAVYDNQQPVSESYKTEHIPTDKFIVGYAGSIGMTNALDTLIECAHRMQDIPQVYFLLLGGGDMLEQYKQRCEGLPNIGFAPKVKREQVGDVLKACDILYFSVKDSEVWRYGLSLNKLIDYMYAGKPVLASYSGFPSMINEAECGTFVPAGDVKALQEKICQFQKMPSSQLAEMGECGRKWLIEHREYRKIATAYLELL